MEKQNYRQLISISKSNVLPAFGLAIIIFFNSLAYLNNSIFLDKIIMGSFIVGLVLFSKVRGESNMEKSDTDENF